MEKFSHFRDKATGIGPFFTIPGITLQGLGAIDLLRYTVGSAVSAVIRIPLILILFGIVALIPSRPSFSYDILRPLLSLLILVAGISTWDVQVEGQRKKDTQKSLPTPGSIIITNFVSPLDPLVYQCISNSLFVIPVTSADGKNVVYQKHSLASALFAALSLPKLLKGSESVFAAKSLQDISAEAKTHGQVVIVFGEGTTSNGKGLLPLILSEEDSPDPKTVKDKPTVLHKFPTYPAAIRYGRSYITTPTPISFISWLWKLVHGFLFSSVRIRYAAPLHSKDLKEGTSGKSSSSNVGDSTSSQSSDSSYKSQVSNGICRVGRVKEVGLGVKAKLEFMEAAAKKR